MSTFSERLEIIREYFGLKGNAFSEQLGIPYRSYMNYKAGRTPPADLLTKIIEEFAIDPTWLMTGEGSMELKRAASAALPAAAAPSDFDESEASAASLDGDVLDELSLLAESPADAPDESADSQALQLRLMKHLVDLHEENRSLRSRIQELEHLLVKERTRCRKLLRG